MHNTHNYKKQKPKKQYSNQKIRTVNRQFSTKPPKGNLYNRRSAPTSFQYNVNENAATDIPIKPFKTNINNDSGDIPMEAASSRSTRSSEALFINKNQTDSKPFDRGDSKPFDRDSKPFDRGNSKPFDRDSKPFDRDSKPFGRDSKPFDRDSKPSFRRDSKPSDRDAKPFDRESKPFGRDSKPSNNEKPRFYGKPDESYFHYDNNGADDDDDSITYRTKQEVLFSTPPKYAPQSSWKNIRDNKAPNKYTNPHLPVPLVGEALYGTHAIYAAIAAKKRKIHNLYILSSALENAKKAARPDSFRDKDVVLTKKNKHQYAQQNPAFTDSEDSTDENTINEQIFDDDEAHPDFLASSTQLGSLFDDSQSEDEFGIFSHTSLQASQSQNKLSSSIDPHHIAYSREPLYQIYELALAAGIRVTALRRDKLDILSGNKPHNGIVLDADPPSVSKQTQLTEENIFPSIKIKQPLKNIETSSQSDDTSSKSQTIISHRPSIYLAMDSFFDPNNVGAVLRSATFFGIDGVIMPHNSCPLSPAAAKVASGALDSIPIIRCNTLSQFLTETLNQDYTQLSQPRKMSRSGIPSFGKLCIVGLGLTKTPNNVSGTDIFDFLRQQNQTVDETNKQGNIEPFSIVLIAGNESAGLSKELSDLCHLIYSIPNRGHYPSRFKQQKLRPLVDSLNVSNAVAIALSEVMTSRDALNFKTDM